MAGHSDRQSLENSLGCRGSGFIRSSLSRLQRISKSFNIVYGCRVYLGNGFPKILVGAVAGAVNGAAVAVYPGGGQFVKILQAFVAQRVQFVDGDGVGRQAFQVFPACMAGPAERVG